MVGIFDFLSVAVIHVLPTAVLTAGFAYGYAKGTIKKLPPDMLLVLSIGLFIGILMHGLAYGMGKFLRIPGFMPIVRRINSMFDGVTLKDGLPVEDYKKLLEDLVKLPRIRLYVSVVDVLMVGSLPITYDLISMNGANYLHYLVIAAISLPIHAQFAFVTADLALGEYRSQVKERIFELGETPPNYHSLSLKLKFTLSLAILILSTYIMITLMRSDVSSTPEGFHFILMFSVFALVLLIILTGMYFSSIFISVEELRQAAKELSEGKDPRFFSRASDLELANLSEGFFDAAQRVLNYQRDLEGQVEERTAELRKAMEELAEKDHEIQMELNFAADIQKGIIPHNMSPWNGISFSGTYLPMGKVSGDYYDIFRKADSVYILMADVSGHGVPAALITMAAKQAFSLAMSRNLDPAETFRMVNNDILERVKTQDYLTAFMMKVDEKNNITFSNASHQKAIHYVAATSEIKLYDTNGLFIGAMDEANDTYENGETSMQSGDRIYLFTDGIVEHKNEAGEEFGTERFLSLIQETASSTLEESEKRIITELQEFMGEAPVRDDISILAFELDKNWGKFVELYNDALKLIQQSDNKEARDKLLQAKRLISTFPKLNLNLARVHYKLEELEMASDAIEQYLDKMPNDIKGLQQAAAIYTRKNDIDSAKNIARRMKALMPTEEKTLKLIERILQM